MNAQRIDEYHNHGCHFYGKLVLVKYQEAMQADRKFGQFNAGVTFDYIAKAKALIDDRQYKVVRVLLSIPDYVVEIE